MNSLAKMFVGVLIALAGIAWYVVPGFKFYGVSPVSGLVMVFAGTFGAMLLIFGLLMAWVEYEDWKWELREKQELKKAKKPAKRKKKKR